MGDFGNPEIFGGTSATQTGPSNTFLIGLSANVVFQKVEGGTHRPAVLDPLLTNGEELVEEMKAEAVLRGSDQVLLAFTIQRWGEKLSGVM